MEYNKEYLKSILPKRPENSHKGTFGHVLNIAGSGFYIGAAYFSSIAPLKVGCGRITLASVKPVSEAISSLSPDIILMPLDETKEKTIASKSINKLEKVLINYDVVSLGCGLSTNKDTVKFFAKLIKVLSNLEIPVVIDADGLNILALRHCETLSGGFITKYSPKQSCAHKHLPPNTILTPHPLELSRLMKVGVENILSEPESWVKKCCEKYQCTTVLKLHETLIADNKGNFYENKTGNTALSHGGSGDVLCGMITGFLAQGLDCFEASVLGVYLHGVAAEFASSDLTEYSTLSSDLLKYIPKAIKTIL